MAPWAAFEVRLKAAVVGGVAHPPMGWLQYSSKHLGASLHTALPLLLAAGCWLHAAIVPV